MLVNGVLEMKDPAGLKEAIKAAAKRTPTQAEMMAQRVSFVFSSVGEKSGVTKEQVRKALAGDTTGVERF